MYDLKPTQEQIDKAIYLYRNGARNIMDACDRVCTGNNNFKALMMITCEELGINYALSKM